MMGNGVRVSFPHGPPWGFRRGSAVVPPRFRRGSVWFLPRFRRGSARFRAVPRGSASRPNRTAAQRERWTRCKFGSEKCVFHS